MYPSKTMRLYTRVPVIIDANPINFTKFTETFKDYIRYGLTSATFSETIRPVNQISAVLHTFRRDRVRLSISLVIVTP